MAISFNNPFFQDHYDTSIKPIVRRIETASNLLDQHGQVNELIDAVETAARIFPTVGEDITALQNLQQRVISEVQSPSRVEAQTADPEVMRAFKPAGIRRDGMNCWANTILQILVNAPSIAQTILRKRTDVGEELSPLLQTYYQAQIEEKEIAEGIDGQLLRQFSTQLSPHRGVMEDPITALEGMLEKLEFNYNFRQERLFGDGTKRQSPVFRKEQMIQLDLMSKNRTFKDLIESFFLSQTDDGSLLRLKFHKTPDDLLLHMRRFGQTEKGHVKVTDDVSRIPSYFDFDPKYVENGTGKVHYELMGAIIHQGSGLDSGHYISLIKKPDHWYIVDDHLVREVDSKEAEALLKQAYLLHYRKAERLPEADDFEMMDVDGTEPAGGWTVVSLVKNALFSAVAMAVAPLLNYLQWSK